MTFAVLDTPVKVVAADRYRGHATKRMVPLWTPHATVVHAGYLSRPSVDKIRPPDG